MQVQFACEECGEPVTRNSSSGEDSDSEAILCRACDPSNRVLSPQQVQSIRAEIDNAVRTLSQAKRLQGRPWQQSLMAGQQGMHSTVPAEAWAAAGQPGGPGSAITDWRAGLEHITLLTGGLQNTDALRVSSEQQVLQEPIPHAAGMAELADAACHIAATAADSSMLGAPFASPPRQPLDGSADALPEVNSAPVGMETDTLPDTQQGHSLPATQAKCGLDSPDAGTGPSPKRLCAGSPQAGSRVRMKQRELVPVQHLLAAKYPWPGRTAQNSSLSGRSCSLD